MARVAGAGNTQLSSGASGGGWAASRSEHTESREGSPESGKRKPGLVPRAGTNPGRGEGKRALP